MPKRGRKRKDSPERIARERLEVLDDLGQVIAILPRGLIHQQRLRHRAVHIFLFDSRGRLYLQKRAQTKDENPGLWDSSAAGHVEPGEPPTVAARRELQEELGLVCNLEEVLHLEPSPETGWEFVTLFVGFTSREPKPDPLEVEKGRFVSPEELERLLLQRPEEFTTTLKILWRLFSERKKRNSNKRRVPSDYS